MTGQVDVETQAAALRLLLGDLDPQTQVLVIRNAFYDDLHVGLKKHSFELRLHTEEAMNTLGKLMDELENQSSPLGIESQKKLYDIARQCHAHIRSAQARIYAT